MEGPAAEERICSMAFGPGLTVETGLFTKIRQATGGAPGWEGSAAEDALGQLQSRTPAEAPVA